MLLFHHLPPRVRLEVHRAPERSVFLVLPESDQDVWFLQVLGRVFEHLLELVQPMGPIQAILLLRCEGCIEHSFDQWKQQLEVLIRNVQISKCLEEIFDVNQGLSDVLDDFIQGPQRERRLMLKPSLLVGLDINRELSGLQPAPLEVDPNLLLAVAHHWEEDHVQKVLEPQREEGPPVVRQGEQPVSQVVVLDTLYTSPHGVQ